MSYSAEKLRSDLAQLEKANDEELDQAFRWAKQGNSLQILPLVKKYPGILSQTPKNNPNTNLINEIISGILTNESESVCRKLIKLLGKLVDKHSDKIDLTLVDEKKNTLLHRIFWAAITIKNSAFSKILLEIGITLINLIKEFTDFRPLMTRKDSQGTSFLQFIYFTPTRKEISTDSLNSVQLAVAKSLNPYNSIIDFTKQSFTQRLAHLLYDPLTFEPMETPLICPAGYTLSKRSWDNLKNGINPLSTKPFNKSKLKPNQYIFDIIQLFNTHYKKEEVLVDRLNDYFDKLGGRAPQNPDRLFSAIDTLLEEYDNQFSYEDDHGEDPDEATILEQGFRASIISNFLAKLQSNILNLENGRSSCFSVNSKQKAHKLSTIAHWVNKKGFDKDRQILALALIQDVCKIPRNNWGYWPPHSVDEFNTFMTQNKEYFKIPEDYSYDKSLLTFLEKPVDAMTKLDEYVMTLRQSHCCLP